MKIHETWVSEFLSLLYLLPLRKRCTSTTDLKNKGVKSRVLVLKTLGVKTLSHLSCTYNESYLMERVLLGHFAKVSRML